MNHGLRTQIQVRRLWRTGETVFLLGPGGVGKSSVGRDLSQRLGWALLDLDFEFCARIAEIGWFVRTEGYDAYRAENLSLADRLIRATDGPLVFVTSSGFLAASPGSADHLAARRLVQTGYGVTLLPSLDTDLATSIVVERQLTRGFGFERDAETQKFLHRFDIYKDEGELLVISAATPAEIAAAIVRALEHRRLSGDDQRLG